MEMNETLYQITILDKSHRGHRKELPEVAAEYAALGLSDRERMTRRFEWFCREEIPYFLPTERICFTRTVGKQPNIYTEEEWAEIREKYRVFELGFSNNIVVNYGKILQNGLLWLKEGSDEYTCRSIDALLGLVERYRAAAQEQGLTEIAENLARVPAYGAQTFLQALQTVRILNFALWLEGDYHNTLGRFDQYIYPYYKADREAGRIDDAQAQELIEEFFLSLNRDSDLYHGMQKGDNGQSLVLGGRTKDGKCGVNEITRMGLIASRNLKLIDPKINIRVDKDTPDDLYTLCSELTKVGLGFPQYSNDDVVIPALIRMGYDPEDAADYAMAACWEFIIPHVGFDVPNAATMYLPRVIDAVMREKLEECADMEQFLDCLDEAIRTKADEIIAMNNKTHYVVPSPLQWRLMDEPKYRNYAMFGVGMANAADCLASIHEHIFLKKDVTVAQLIKAVDEDFANDPELLHLLRYETPKVGCDDERADDYLCWIVDHFSDALKGKKNIYGGIWRAGTGTAMHYLWAADTMGASPDGRRKGEPLGANYAISLFARPEGPFSIIRSMTKPDLSKVMNGGPLTLEFHESMFNTPEATYQVGQFVKEFIRLGGHQLQLCVINSERLKDAQAHPEKYPLLIVRIWGWSAYFVELEKPYQDHVIRRQTYAI